MAPTEAMKWARRQRAFPYAAIDADLVELGIENSARYQISYWNGSVVAAAERLGAGILYSEDLNDGQKFGSVQESIRLRSGVAAGGLGPWFGGWFVWA